MDISLANINVNAWQGATYSAKFYEAWGPKNDMEVKNSHFKVD